MKKLLLTLLVVAVAGCAAPYQTVYTEGDGSYYIPKMPPSLSRGYGSSISYWDYGFYPWWSTAGYYGYSSYPFFYYSPNFHPHYFSVWSPDWHHGQHSWGGSWRPPYRHVRHEPVANPSVPADPSDRPARRVVAPLPVGSHKAYPWPSRRGPGTDPRRFPVDPDFVADPAGPAAAGFRAPRRASAPSQRVNVPRARYSKRDGQ